MMWFGSGYGGAGMFGYSFLWIFFFVLMSFIFSLIFWLTYAWLIRPARKKRR